MYVKGSGQTERFSEVARSEAVAQTVIQGHSHIVPTCEFRASQHQNTRKSKFPPWVVLLEGLKSSFDIVSVRKFPFPELTRGSAKTSDRNLFNILPNYTRHRV
jgi:hypothetical protein